MTKTELIKVLRTAENGNQLLDLADKLATLVEREQEEQEEPVAV